MVSVTFLLIFKDSTAFCSSSFFETAASTIFFAAAERARAISISKLCLCFSLCSASISFIKVKMESKFVKFLPSSSITAESFSQSLIASHLKGIGKNSSFAESFNFSTIYFQKLECQIKMSFQI